MQSPRRGENYSRKVSVLCSGTKDMSDPAKLKDLHWERMKTILITRAGCIGEDFKDEIFFLDKKRKTPKIY